MFGTTPDVFYYFIRYSQSPPYNTLAQIVGKLFFSTGSFTAIRSYNF